MDKVTTDLIAKAMEGDVSARLTLAEVFNDPQHNFYYPGKSLDMYVKLAREGNQQAYYPLAEMFSNPDSEQYNPARSVLYLKKLPDVPKGRILLSEVLSYRVPLSRISTEITSRDIPVSDPYYQLLKALEYFPFDSASAEMRKHLIEVSELEKKIELTDDQYQKVQAEFAKKEPVYKDIEGRVKLIKLEAK